MPTHHFWNDPNSPLNAHLLRAPSDKLWISPPHYPTPLSSRCNTTMLPHPNGCNAQDRPLLSGKKPTIIMRHSGKGRESSIIFVVPWKYGNYTVVRRYSKPTNDVMMCIVDFHVIAHNSASRWSYGERHICVHCCRNGESNGLLTRLLIGVLLG